MTIVAVAMRTESGDDYLSLFTDIESIQDFVERVEENMGEELAYVYSVSVCTDDMLSNNYERALCNRRDEMRAEDDE